MRLSKRSIITLVLAAAVLVAGALAAAPQKKAAPKGQVKIENTDPAQRVKAFEQHVAMKASSPFKDVRWRFIGPFDLGGRCTDVAVPKGSRTVFYAAAATGGVFKTANAGTTWEPIFDDQPTLSIGDLAVAESDPNIVWAGTGEANIFRASEAGLGIFKSTDAGKTWKRMGLEATYTIARVVVHPSNPDIVYVAATGHEWTANPDRGVYKTTDGGATWLKVLYINEKVGANDLAMDPQNPDTLYAATWNRIRRRWSDPVPGGEDGLYKTTDGGKTWTPINAGLPDTSFTGRIGLDLCRTKPTTLYAYVDNHSPGAEPAPGQRDSYGRPAQRGIVGAEVYRSDDSGASWRKVNTASMDRFGGTYGWVFGQIRVDPNSPETIYIMGLGLSKSTDGGKTYQNLVRRRAPRRPPRPVDRPRRQQPPHQQQRRRGQHLLRRRQDLARFPRRHPLRPVLQRRLRLLDPVLGLRLGPGPGHLPRPHPSDEADGGRPGRAAPLRRDPAEMGDRAGRRGHAHRRRSDRPEHGLFVVVLRPPRAVRIQGRPVAEQADLPQGRPRRARSPRPVAGGDDDLAAQPPDRLPRLPVPLPVHEQGRDLGEDQPRPDLQQPRGAGQVALRHPVRHDHGRRRVALQVRPPLRRHGRRPRLDDPQRRRRPGPRSRPGSPTRSTSGRSSPPSTTRPPSTSRSSAGTTTTSTPISSSRPTRARPGSPSPATSPAGRSTSSARTPRPRTSSTRARTRASTSAATAARPGTSSAATCRRTTSGTSPIHPRDNAMIIATNGRGMWVIDDLGPVQNAAK